jgi:hypothetical protein
VVMILPTTCWFVRCRTFCGVSHGMRKFPNPNPTHRRSLLRLTVHSANGGGASTVMLAAVARLTPVGIALGRAAVACFGGESGSGSGGRSATGGAPLVASAARGMSFVMLLTVLLARLTVDHQPLGATSSMDAATAAVAPPALYALRLLDATQGGALPPSEDPSHPFWLLYDELTAGAPAGVAYAANAELVYLKVRIIP